MEDIVWIIDKVSEWEISDKIFQPQGFMGRTQ